MEIDKNMNSADEDDGEIMEITSDEEKHLLTDPDSEKEEGQGQLETSPSSSHSTYLSIPTPPPMPTLTSPLPPLPPTPTSENLNPEEAAATTSTSTALTSTSRRTETDEEKAERVKAKKLRAKQKAKERKQRRKLEAGSNNSGSTLPANNSETEQNTSSSAVTAPGTNDATMNTPTTSAAVSAILTNVATRNPQPATAQPTASGSGSNRTRGEKTKRQDLTPSSTSGSNPSPETKRVKAVPYLESAKKALFLHVYTVDNGKQELSDADFITMKKELQSEVLNYEEVGLQIDRVSKVGDLAVVRCADEETVSRVRLILRTINNGKYQVKVSSSENPNPEIKLRCWISDEEPKDFDFQKFCSAVKLQSRNKLDTASWKLDFLAPGTEGFTLCLRSGEESYKQLKAMHMRTHYALGTLNFHVRVSGAERKRKRSPSAQNKTKPGPVPKGTGNGKPGTAQ